MDTKLIECKLIDVPKVPTEKRTFDKEFAVKLADSLKIDSQIVPIVVRPNPANPLRYILLDGRHRLYGMKVVLKEQFINACIFDDMDDAEAAIVSDVANLWRNPLNKAQHAGAVKRWHAHWVAKLPKALEAEAVVVAEGETKAIGGGEPVYQSDKSAAEPVVEVKKESDFDNQVAAVTGQSIAAVRRAKRIGAAFTAEQLEAFDQMDTSATDMTTIAKIEDVGKRAEVVALVASGMVPVEAIREVMKDKAPVRDTGKAVAEVAAQAAAKAEVKAELTDEEWFDAECGVKANMLGNASKYKSDALLFRIVSESRHAFRVKNKKAIGTTKRLGVTGAFYNLLNRFISIAHPKDWLICPECKGKGTVDSGASAEDVAKMGPGYATKSCPKCFGGGYLLKTEEYL